MKKRTKAILAGTTVAGGAAALYLLWPRPKVPLLEATDVSATSVLNADKSTTVSISMFAIGGIPPYTYTINWPDGQTETNGTGQFTRTFPPFTPVPGVAIVVVQSSDGQSVSVDG